MGPPHRETSDPSHRLVCVGGEGGRAALPEEVEQGPWVEVSNKAAYSSVQVWELGKGVHILSPHPVLPGPWTTHGHKGARGTVTTGTPLAGNPSRDTVHRGLFFLSLLSFPISRVLGF